MRSIWCISISFCAKQLKIHSKCKLSVKKISWKQQSYIRSTKELISRNFSFGERECLVFPRRCAVYISRWNYGNSFSHIFDKNFVKVLFLLQKLPQRVDFTRISRFSTLLYISQCTAQCGNCCDLVSYIFGKNFVKVTFLQKRKILKSYFDEIYFLWD